MDICKRCCIKYKNPARVPAVPFIMFFIQERVNTLVYCKRRHERAQRIGIQESNNTIVGAERAAGIHCIGRLGGLVMLMISVV